MKTKLIFTVVAFYCTAHLCLAHGSGSNPKLHVNPRWKECSLQLDPSLTQAAWHQFAKEAGLVAYFRSLTDAKPMGLGRFELSILQWQTGIHANDNAWNDTFVHPDSTHWLFEGNSLAFPGLTLRAGITPKIDVGIYLTKNFGANYGFLGGQVQYNFLNNIEKNWSASARGNFVMMYGPEDLGLNIYGVDLLASKKYSIYSNWISISPYAGISSYLSHTHAKTTKVNLKDENVIGIQSMIGTVIQISVARLAVEYNLAKVNTLSFKLGINFSF